MFKTADGAADAALEAIKTLEEEICVPGVDVGEPQKHETPSYK